MTNKLKEGRSLLRGGSSPSSPHPSQVSTPNHHVIPFSPPSLLTLVSNRGARDPLDPSLKLVSSLVRICSPNAKLQVKKVGGRQLRLLGCTSHQLASFRVTERAFVQITQSNFIVGVLHSLVSCALSSFFLSTPSLNANLWNVPKCPQC